MRRIATALVTATLLGSLLPIPALAAGSTPQTISFGALGAKTYGDAAFAISASTDSKLQITFSSLTGGVCNVAPDAFDAGTGVTTGLVTIVAHGTCTIEATQDGDTTYAAAAPVDQGFTIAKAAQTVTAANKAITYGDPDPVFTATYGAWQYSDTSAVLTTAPTCDVTGPHTDVAGSPYAITCSGAAADNYTFNYVSGSLTINPATPHCAVTPYATTYSGAAHVAQGSCTGVGGATLTGLDLSGTTHTNAGTYSNDPWTYTDSAGNYASASGTVTDAIAKATASCAITPYSVSYDATAHTATGSCTGVLSEALAAPNLTGTTHTAAGSYPTDPWTFADPTGNYSGASGTVADSIGKVDVLCTVQGYSVTYNGVSHVATGSCTGVGGVTVLGLSLSGTAHTAAGTYNDAWTFTDPAGNYNSTSGLVSDTIGQATASCAVTAYSVPYDGTSHTATGSCTGVGGATVGVIDFSQTAHTNAGSHPSDPWSFSDPNGNYAPLSGTVSDLITKIDAVCTVTPYSATYDAAAHTATGACVGLDGVTPLATLDVSGTSHTGAGTYTGDPWTFTDASGNYNNASGTVDDVIAKAGQTIDITSGDPSPVLKGQTYTPVGLATSGLAVVFTIDPSSTGVCGMDGLGVVTFTAAPGDCILNADQPGNANWNAAPRVQLQISIGDRKPVCSPPATLDVVMNVAATGSGNCSDPDANPLTYAIGTDGTKGHATIDSSGNWTYTPDPNTIGVDSFTVVANDGIVDSNPATIDVTISNHPVTGSLQIQHVRAVLPTTINVLALVNPGAGDTNQPLTVTAVTQGTNGRVSTDSHTVTYDPNGCSTAVDAFTFTASDGLTSTVVQVAVVVDRPGQNGQPLAPVTDTPGIGFITGSTIGSTTPMRLGWCSVVAPTTSLWYYRVVQSTNGGVTWPALATMTAATSMTLNLGGYRYVWAVRAVDRAGRSSPYATSVSARVFRVQDTGTTAIVYRGSWGTVKSTSYSGGTERWATSVAATATYTTTTAARAFAIVASKASTRGSFRVYVDGVLVATVSQRTSATQYRNVVYARLLSPGVAHTIIIKPAGTGRIDIDAILTLG